MVEDTSSGAPHQLVQEFVRVTTHLRATEAGRLIGVTAGTIQRWRRTPPAYPEQRVRRRLQEYLGWVEGTAHGTT